MSEFISGVIGALIGFLGSFLALRLEYKKLFAKTVSKSRMEWIDNFREEFSVFFGTCSYLMNQHISENEELKKDGRQEEENGKSKNDKVKNNGDKNESLKEQAMLEAREQAMLEAREQAMLEAREKAMLEAREKAMLEAERARVKLLTRLNQDITKQGNEYNKIFSNLLMDIDLSNLQKDGKSNGNSNDFGEIMNQAVKYARKILEPEWARVKKEAKGEEQNV